MENPKNVTKEEYARRRALWVQALREEGRVQNICYLERLNEEGAVVGQCCLGVACEIAIKDGLDLKVGRKTFATLGRDKPYQTTRGVTTYNGEQSLPPCKLIEWLGLSSQYVFVNLSPYDGNGEREEQDAFFSEALGLGSNFLHLTTLIWLNDSQMLSFAQIAELVEKFPETLFAKGTC